ncbi:MAG TPA: maleylpyruvate isomerase family mycothiol-dependent enzyme [Nocardioides sp.]|nr:maleylpyruvate isomerase family mycothiol-dependent enzyme [Nocardioides sp.]
MARLDFPDYLEHIRSESRRFREVLSTCDPEARVPGCPEWNAADLLWHLAEVQWFWAKVVRTRPLGPDENDPGPERPAAYDDLLKAFDEYSSSLVSELEQADPADEAWTWSDDHTVGFTFRRQAHEALIHRLDAEQAAGDVTRLDTALAADGVEEVLDVMYGASPDWGSFSPLEHRLRVDITDTGESIWVQLGRFRGTDPKDDVHYDEDDISVIPDPGVEPDAVISGDAATLVTRFWRRGDGAEIHLAGDLQIVDHFRQVIHQPIT